MSIVDQDGPFDGRSARRQRIDAAVLDAVIELFADDLLTPRPEEVARRSGVSLRSVYRYFSDPAELLRAAMAHHLEKVTPLLRLPAIGEGPLEDRIDRFVESRLRLYEAIAPVARAARAAAPHNDAIRARYQRTRSLLREQVGRHFGPELRRLPAGHRRAVTDGIDALFQLEGYDHLRQELGRSPARTADTQRQLLRTLLT